MNASFMHFTKSRRWLLVLLLATCLAFPALAGYFTDENASPAATEQMQLAGPKDDIGG